MRSAKSLVLALVFTLQFINTATLAGREYYSNPNAPKCCRCGSHYKQLAKDLVCDNTTYTNHVYYGEDAEENCKVCLEDVSCGECLGSGEFCGECVQLLKNATRNEASCKDCQRAVADRIKGRIFCGGCLQDRKTCDDCKRRRKTDETLCEKCEVNKICTNGCSNHTENDSICANCEFEQFCIECAEVNNTPSDCVEVLKKHDTSTIISVDRVGNREAVKYNFYPKCCPMDSLYSPLEHKCVKRAVQKFAGYARIDLSTCKTVLVDYLNILNYTIDHQSLTVTLKLDVHPTDSDNYIVKKLNENNNKHVFKYGDYCWDENAETGGNVLRACVSAKVCRTRWNPGGITCVPKCCPDGQHFIGTCTSAYTHGIDSRKLGLYEDFAIMKAEPLRKYSPPLADPKIDDFGVLSTAEKNYSMHEYCLDYHLNRQRIFLFSANEQAVEDVKLYFKKVLVTVSCVFLCLTLVCYFILAEMRENLYGKCVMIYCSIFLLGFIMLTYMNFQPQSLNGNTCYVIGFVLIFSFLGTFSWLNIICFDMWMAFGQIRVRTLRTKRNDCKKLLYYNLYGWGVPMTITLIVFGMNQASWIPDYLRPNIGRKKCFLEKDTGNYGHLLCFIVPLSILIISNFVLFLKTISYCFKVKNEISKMRDTLPSEKAKRNKSLNADKEKLAVLIKLFVIMGISWLFEILTSFMWFQQNAVLSYIEVIMDSINSLQGVCVFCILLLKRKVFESLKSKIFPKLLRRSSESSTTMTSVYSYIRNKDNVNANRNISETRR